MKKLAKRFLLVIAILLVAGLAVIIAGIYLIRGTPSFYRSLALSADQLEAAAQSATNKFATIQNRIARHSADTRASASSTARSNVPTSCNSQSAASAVEKAEPSIEIAFTADELNAFFDKWSSFQNWKSTYARYLADPVIALEDGRLILAGKAVDLDLLVSLHFEPSIDDDGRLRLRLDRILGGRLPLPKALIESWETKATNALAARLPKWRSEAAFDSGGAANSSLIAATSAMMLFRVLRDEPAEPVLFVPVLGQRGSVPVRMRNVAVVDGKLTLKVDPMTREECDDLLRHIRTDPEESVSVIPAKIDR